MTESYEHERPKRRNEVTERSLPPLVLPPLDPELWGIFEWSLQCRFLNPAVAVANRWYPTSEAGDTEPRIVIPGTPISRGPFWQARAMSGAALLRYQSPHGPREDSIVIVCAVGKLEQVVICEGPMDALAAAGEGSWGIALMGNTPPLEVLENVVRQIRNFGPKSVLFVEDQDAAGSLVRIMPYVLSYIGKETLCRLTVAYPGKDLAACSPAERQRLLAL